MEFNATFLISAISFVIFTLIMNKILYAPISEIVDRRNTYLEENKKDTEKNKLEAQNILEDKNSKIKEAKKTTKMDVAQKMDEAKEKRAKTFSLCKEKANKKVDEHKKNLKDEILSLDGEIENCANSLSDDILSKLKEGN